MIITIKYDSSDGPHIMHLSEAQIFAAKKNHPTTLHVRCDDPAKTLTIQGSEAEFRALGTAIRPYY